MKTIPMINLTPYAEELGVKVNYLKNVLRERKKPLKPNTKIDAKINNKIDSLKAKMARIQYGISKQEKKEQKEADRELNILCLKKLAKANIFSKAKLVWNITPEYSISETLALLKMAKLSKMRGEIRETAKTPLPIKNAEIIESYIAEVKNLFYKNR